MSAIDILGKLDGFNVNLWGSSQRVLLITDGTLTEILEAYFAERISLVKVSQQMIPATVQHALLNSIPGENLIERKILLQGTRSRTNYVYAESLIAVDRLAPSFRDQLLNSDTPLGRLWLEHKLETFKQMHELRCRPARSLAHYFASGEEEPLLARTYRVISADRVVMVISEYFPVAYREVLEARGVERSALAGAAR